MGKHFHLSSDIIQEQIEDYILENQLHPGDKLPSERAFSEKFNVNRITLRNALKHLQDEGIITARQGSGNYIAEPKYFDNANTCISFSEGWRLEHQNPSSKEISFRTVEATKKIAKNLNIALGTSVYELKRIRYINKTPVIIETTYLKKDMFPGLMQFNFEKLSLYSILNQYYHTKPTIQNHTISITHLSAEEASLLDQKELDGAFYLNAITLDESKNVIEYCISICRADKYALKNSLTGLI